MLVIKIKFQYICFGIRANSIIPVPDIIHTIETCHMYLQIRRFIFGLSFSVFLILVAVLFNSFQSGRHNPSYSEAGMGHDTLAFNLPFVEVISLSNGKESIDTALSRSVRKILVEGTVDLLDRKYVIETVKSDLTIEVFEQPAVMGYLDSLSKMGKRFRDLGIPDLLWQLFPSKGRYCLLMLYSGKYNSNFQPYHNQRQSMVHNSIINGPGLVNSNLEILLFDRVERKLLEIDQFSTNKDPRVADDLDALLHKALKSIYYR